MNDKAKKLLEDFLNEIPQNERILFKSIAEYTVSLGYQPQKTKTRVFKLDFINNKLKKQ